MLSRRFHPASWVMTALLVMILFGLAIIWLNRGLPPFQPTVTDQDQQSRLVAEEMHAQVSVEGLEIPWSLQLDAQGNLYFTERDGRLSMIRAGEDQPQLLAEIEVAHVGEGGLLGLALDPDFPDNHHLYLYHTYQQAGQIQNRVVRLTRQEDRYRQTLVVVDNIPGAANHNGGRIAFGPDNMLYITTGDAQQPNLAQDQHALAGKILRLNADGSIPDDNPFEGSPVYSYGHRNPQGIAWHPHTGELFATEHGPLAQDEVNRIEPGQNYGWPEVSGEGDDERFVNPVVASGHDTWAPSGMVFITHPAWPENWQNTLLFTGLRSSTLWLLPFYQGQVQTDHLVNLFNGSYGRLRDITQGPDGSLYLATNNRDGRGNPSPEDDRIIRLTPSPTR